MRERQQPGDAGGPEASILISDRPPEEPAQGTRGTCAASCPRPVARPGSSSPRETAVLSVGGMTGEGQPLASSHIVSQYSNSNSCSKRAARRMRRGSAPCPSPSSTTARPCSSNPGGALANKSKKATSCPERP